VKSLNPRNKYDIVDSTSATSNITSLMLYLRRYLENSIPSPSRWLEVIIPRMKRSICAFGRTESIQVQLHLLYESSQEHPRCMQSKRLDSSTRGKGFTIYIFRP
jgi:hypothetical protein